MLIQQKLDEMTVKYADSRASVARFLLEKKAKVNQMSMQQVADATFTSKPTLVRIAKGLGFCGWGEFVRNYIEELYRIDKQVTHSDANLPFDKGDSAQEIANKISSVMIESITDTASMLDITQLEEAVRILERSRRIAVFCLPPNTLLAELFRRKMLLIGKPVEILNHSDQAFNAVTMTDEDCAIMISYSGSNANRAPMRSLTWLKEHRVPVISITSMGDNLLRRESDCVLTMSSMEKPFSKIATYATEEAIAYLLNLLYSCFFARNYDRNLTYKLEAAKSIERQRYASNGEKS